MADTSSWFVFICAHHTLICLAFILHFIAVIIQQVKSTISAWTTVFNQQYKF